MTKRLEKTLATSLLDIDKIGNKKLNFEQLGRLFTLLGIFRVIQYSENLERSYAYLLCLIEKIVENEEQFYSNVSTDQSRRNAEVINWFGRS